MAALTTILELEELRKDTAITKSIVASIYLSTTNARSRERGANALLVLCGNAYAWLATPYMSLQLCIYVCR